MAKDRVSISLSDKNIKVLEKLSEDKGLSKSVIVALALEKLAKEENREKSE